MQSASRTITGEDPDVAALSAKATLCGNAAEELVRPSSEPASPAARSPLFYYGLSLLSVAAALALKLEFQRHDLPFPFTSFSLAAIALSFWYGGRGPGVLAVISSSVAVAFVIAVPNSNSLSIQSSFLNHVLLAVLVSWIVSSRRHADRLLAQAHSELELKVNERTASLRLTNDELQIEVAERKRAEEALRASEQVARGQVDALVYSLDVLASAPDLDNFFESMLGTTARLLNGTSEALWLHDAKSDSLVLRVAAVDPVSTVAGEEHPLIADPMLWKQDGIVQETFSTGAPAVFEDLDHDPRVSPAMREYFRAIGTKKCLTVPVLLAGNVRGLISIRHGERPPYRPEEIELAQALAHQAMLAIQLTELAGQRQQAAVLEERNRIARDIHDTLAQGFTGVIIQLEAAEDAISSSLMNEAGQHMHRAADLARQSLSEARRSVSALRPKALEDANFWEALQENIKLITAGTTLRTGFQLSGPPRELPATWQANLLRIGQEALTNTLKHAHATQFNSRLSFNGQDLRLELSDDGDGFEVRGRHDGFGLAGMRERVAQMGGTLTVTSTQGAGTKLVVVLPFKEELLP